MYVCILILCILGTIVLAPLFLFIFLSYSKEKKLVTLFLFIFLSYFKEKNKLHKFKFAKSLQYSKS